MSRKPENTFIDGMHKHLPPVKFFHREKMNNPYSSGTADWWYSGNKADLWVEYKYIKPVPVKKIVIPDLSALQLDWLESRKKEGRNVKVIVGCPKGGVIYDTPEQWISGFPANEYLARLLTRADLAKYLLNSCMK